MHEENITFACYFAVLCIFWQFDESQKGEKKPFLNDYILNIKWRHGYKNTSHYKSSETLKSSAVKIKHNWWLLRSQTCTKLTEHVINEFTASFSVNEAVLRRRKHRITSWSSEWSVCFTLKHAAKTDLMKRLRHIVLSVWVHLTDTA